MYFIALNRVRGKVSPKAYSLRKNSLSGATFLIYHFKEYLYYLAVQRKLGPNSIKYRAILSLCYGSGLRLSEALRVQASDIDSKKMRLFVRKSKDRRERYTLLSHYFYQLLRQYWKKFKPQGLLLFPRKKL